jgi:hypothetical protein
LLKVHLIHGPQIDCFILGQSSESFYAPPVSVGRRVRSPGAACGSETPTAAADAGIVVDRVAHGASFASKPTSFFHPIDFLKSPLHWACPEAPFADRRPDRHSTSKVVRSAIPLADLPDPVLQISPPNKRLFAEHLPANPLPGSNSFHAQQAARRATGGH